MNKTILPHSTKRSYDKPQMQVFQIETKQAMLYSSPLPEEATNDIEFD